MQSKVSELFGVPTTNADADWRSIVDHAHCPYLRKKCVKTRKSQPEVSIGTCTVRYPTKDPQDVIICPHRLLERNRIFADCLHLLPARQPGHDLHLISEVAVPGGSVDYFVVAAAGPKVVDFVGVELQTLDTTGTVWPERQRFVAQVGIKASKKDVNSSKSFGMNWKMSAKTILMQLHHKLQTFETIHKHLVVVIQDNFLGYMQREFRFGHLGEAKNEDSLHLHGYGLGPEKAGDVLRLKLLHRLSTDAAGLATALELQADQGVELAEIVAMLESKLNHDTLLDPLAA